MPTPIPQEITFKPAFLERYRELYGGRFDEFITYSGAYLRKAIRVNTLKIGVDALRARLEPDWDLGPVPWCAEGFWITRRGERRFDVGNLPEHQLGYVYIQEAASMIPPVVLAPRPGETVLDLCAAPGSKTTQIAAMMENSGVLIANDIDAKRLKPLGLNLQRCGVRNTAVTLRGNRQFAPVFDRILVDAPCTGTGTIRKSLKVLQMWSPGLVARMVREQRRLIARAYELLRPGGRLVYSTCTLEPEEDEGVVSWLLGRSDAELLPIDIPIERTPPVTEWRGATYVGVEHVLRISPQDNDTEGFFVAKIGKPMSS